MREVSSGYSNYKIDVIKITSTKLEINFLDLFLFN